MKFHRAQDFTGGQAWEALDIAEIDGATVRLHWTYKPYIWHVNDGAEVFVMVDGTVDMHTRIGGVESVQRMTAGDICHAEPGDEHLAAPDGPARVLVIERKGSV